MVTFIIISVVVVWVLLSGIIVVTASMSSSQFSQRERFLVEHPASHERRFPEYYAQGEADLQGHFDSEKLGVTIR